MMKWEYIREAVYDGSVQSTMNRLGKEGWEIFFIEKTKLSPGFGSIFDFFCKRPTEQKNK